MSKRDHMVQIDGSPLEPYMDSEMAATISRSGAKCPIAGKVPCHASGRTIRFSFDMAHPPSIFLSEATNQRPTDEEVRWFFRFSNVLRGVEHPPQRLHFIRNFTIGNTGDYVTLLPGGSAE